MLINNAITHYEHYMINKELSKETIKSYTLLLKNFMYFIEEHYNGPLSITDITPLDLDDFMAFQKTKGNKASSRSRGIYIFRAFYKYLVRRDIVTIDVSQKLEQGTS